MKVSYRRVDKSDVEQIARLQKEWMEEDITFGYQAEKADNIISNLNEFSYVSECEGFIIGFITAKVHEAKQMAVMQDGELFLEIDDLYIDKKFRDRGIGSGLLEILLSEAHERGIERSLVYSATKELDDVINFYRKHGFKTWYAQLFR